jgi:hypothetical protein
MASGDWMAGGWFDVRSTIDRGEGASPRYLRLMLCNISPLRREDAERVAAEERSKSYVTEVQIVRRQSYRDRGPANP